MDITGINRREFIAGTMAAWVAAGVGDTDAASAGAQSSAASTGAPGSESAGDVGTALRYDGQGHTDRLFETTPRQFAFAARNHEEFVQWQAAFRRRLKELLGVADMEREIKFEYHAERAEVAKKDGYTREKWHLWTEPNVPLPIWVLIPDKPAARPYPLVLTPHGHNEPEIYLGEAKDEHGRKSIEEGQRDIAVQAVREGYLCVHLTTRGFGETRRADDLKAGKLHSCRTGNMHGMLFGRSMIGYRVWDVSRIIDWISRQHEIDPKRIAITGNSGGGTTSVFAPACEERITVAMPSCYFCTFHASIGSIYHCECNYVAGLLRAGEMYDVAGLIAPRPFLAIAGQTDPIFPLEAVRQSHAKLREIYRIAGAEDRCELYVGSGGHRYYKAASWPFARKWFALA